jgi:hypothetical protein
MGATKILWIRGNQVRPAAEYCGPPSTWAVEHLDAAAGIVRLPQKDYGVVVLDFPVPDWTPALLVEHVRRLSPEVPILVRDTSATLE